MKIEEFKRVISDLSEKGHAEKITLFGWFLHVHKGMAHFQTSDIGKCYDALHIGRPASFSGYLINLVQQGKVLKNKAGYRLESRIREGLDSEYGSRESTVQVTQLLVRLPDEIPDLAERTYLDEALSCYKNGAFRAAVVMTWNLAYHHLCDHVLKKHLAAFNARWPVLYPAHHKKTTRAVATMDDFSEELKESEVLELCNSARIITKEMHKILVEKLRRRNTAAHPSSVKFEQLQAEESIDDLIKNVVLKLA